MRFIIIALSAVLVAISTMLPAQEFPEYDNLFVNDLAEILSPQTEQTLAAELSALKEKTGVEMTVLTLKRRALHTPDLTLEAFATQLFDQWGIGDKDRNDGILVMVLRQDREMRIELGAGYGRDWDRAAQQVIDRSFLPAFKAYDYEKGVLDGARDVIDTIALPFHEGAEAPAGDNSGALWGIGIFGGIGALILGGMRLPHWRAARRVCPSCGQRGMSLARRTLSPATYSTTGTGEQTYTCKHCAHSETSTYTISRKTRSRSSSGGFGGGRSGGGGASGRW